MISSRFKIGSNMTVGCKWFVRNEKRMMLAHQIEEIAVAGMPSGVIHMFGR